VAKVSQSRSQEGGEETRGEPNSGLGGSHAPSQVLGRLLWRSHVTEMRTSPVEGRPVTEMPAEVELLAAGLREQRPQQRLESIEGGEVALSSGQLEQEIMREDVLPGTNAIAMRSQPLQQTGQPRGRATDLSRKVA
jgi:hypothetical protein